MCWITSAFGKLGVVAVIVGVPRRENSVRRSIDGAAPRQFQRRHLQGIVYLCRLENFLDGWIVDNECHVSPSTGSAGLTDTDFISSCSTAVFYTVKTLRVVSSIFVA